MAIKLSQLNLNSVLKQMRLSLNCIIFVEHFIAFNSCHITNLHLKIYLGTMVVKAKTAGFQNLRALYS